MSKTLKSSSKVMYEYGENNYYLIIRIILVSITTLLFSIYFYFISTYWFDLSIKYHGFYQLVVFLFFIIFIFLFSKKEFLISNKIKFSEKNRSPTYIKLIALCLLASIIYSAISMPFPPIFNIHGYNALDLGRYFSDYSQLPFLEQFKLMPVSVISSLSTTEIIIGYILKYFFIFTGNNNYYFIFANLLALFFFLASIFPIMLLNTKKPLSSILGFLLIILSIPVLYEPFIKYPNSDHFTIFYSTTLIILTLRFIVTKKIHFIIFILSIAIILRNYLAAIALLFICLFFIYQFLTNKKFLLGSILKFFKYKKNLAFLSLCIIISLSWPLTMYSQYNSLDTTFKKVGLNSDNKSFNDNLADQYLQIHLAGNQVESNKLEEIIKSVTTSDIYYKTYSKPLNIDNVLYKFLLIIFSTPSILLMIFFISIKSLLIAFIYNKKYKELIIVSILWIVSCFGVWILYQNSNYPLIKLIIPAVPAVALINFPIFDNKLFYKKNKKVNSNTIYFILLFFFSSFIFNNIIKPKALAQKIDNIDNAHPDFLYKYGYKYKLLQYIKQNNINPKSILWIVRGEHGGFLPYFIYENNLWEHKWYDDPSFSNLFFANKPEDVVNMLNENGIKYIISMNEKEIQRFLLKGYLNNGISSKFIEMIINKSKLFKKVFYEKKYRGLELDIYEFIKYKE